MSDTAITTTDDVVVTPDAAPADAGTVMGAAPAEGNNQQPAAQAAPEAYEAFKLPDGLDMDEAALSKFTEYAKGQNLSQESAQKAIDMHVGLMQEYIQTHTAQQEKQVQEWASEVRSDKDIGGKNFEATKENINLVMSRFGSDELRDYLNRGYGNYPPLVRFVNSIGRALAEERRGNERAAPAASADPAALLYPTMQ